MAANDLAAFPSIILSHLKSFSFPLKDGYLSDSLEEVASAVALTKLPRNNSEILSVMDSVCMMMTLLLLLSAWLVMMLST